jgi:hypothetical protein
MLRASPVRRVVWASSKMGLNSAEQWGVRWSRHAPFYITFAGLAAFYKFTPGRMYPWTRLDPIPEADRTAQDWLEMGCEQSCIDFSDTLKGQYCYLRALELDPNLRDAWHVLGMCGGTTFQGRKYTAKECFAMADECTGSQRDM